MTATNRYCPLFRPSFTRLLARWACAVLLVGLISPWLPPTSAHAQDGAKARQKAAEAALKHPGIAALTKDDPALSFSFMPSLRENPEATRQLLLAALGSVPPAKNRWRLINRLGEFGQPDDLVLLEEIYLKTQNTREKEVLEGTIAALYQPRGEAEDLTRTVEDFAFVQAGSPKATGNIKRGWALTSWSLTKLQEQGPPPRIITLLRSLRGRVYADKAGLSAKVKSTLGLGNFKKYGELVLDSAEETFPQRSLQGRIRVRMGNPYNFPLAFRLYLGAWGGHIVNKDREMLVLVPPGRRKTVDQGIVLITDSGTEEVRLDLRMREINGGDIPSYQKILLPLQ